MPWQPEGLAPVRVNDAKQLSDFMCYFNSNLAREVCRLADWGDKVWARRYRAIEVSDEPESQRERLKYILSHGVKEFLVEKARLLRHWRKTGACERLGQIVSYADDFVILCASRRQAEASLTQVSRWLEKLGLTIHPTKTRLCHARGEPFDFLGYTFGPTRHWQTGKRFITARPSKKSQKRLKEKVNTLLFRGNPTPWPELRTRLNRLVTGWAEYFKFGYTGEAYTALRWHIAGRVRRFLTRRHKLPRGTGHFGFAEVYGKVGVIDLHQVRLKRRPVHAIS